MKASVTSDADTPGHYRIQRLPAEEIAFVYLFESTGLNFR